MRRTTAIILSALCVTVPLQAKAQSDAVPAFKEVDSMEARVQGCVTCHGQNGQGTNNGYFPRIAGKPAGYLYNQLVAFRDGTRRYAPMNYLVAYLPDPYLREIADYFAKQRPPFAQKEQAQGDVALVARGQTLAENGDAAKNVLLCDRRIHPSFCRRTFPSIAATFRSHRIMLFNCHRKRSTPRPRHRIIRANAMDNGPSAAASISYSRSSIPIQHSW